MPCTLDEFTGSVRTGYKWGLASVLESAGVPYRSDDPRVLRDRFDLAKAGMLRGYSAAEPSEPRSGAAIAGIVVAIIAAIAVVSAPFLLSALR